MVASASLYCGVSEPEPDDVTDEPDLGFVVVSLVASNVSGTESLLFRVVANGHLQGVSVFWMYEDWMSFSMA
jgi:hypothetical protein